MEFIYFGEVIEVKTKCIFLNIFKKNMAKFKFQIYEMKKL